ncbi:MAG: glycosyltransferase family 4 protein, partial [Deltaproteobacteria bacterium]|nr:glycosyltransferase family 4 protein [Deltaproteobacteria bacterium]
VVVVHAHEPLLEKLPFYEDIVDFIADNCEKFFFVSDFVRRSLVSSVSEATGKKIAEKSLVVPMGIHMEKFSGVKIIGKTRSGFLFCGRDIELKGFDLVEKAFSQMPDLRLTAAGINGNGESSANIARIGEIPPEELAALLKKSVALIVPSRAIGKRAEGSPRVILEALASGCIVAASRTGGIPEMIEHGFNGFLFQPDNVEEIIETARMIDRRPAILETIRENGIKTAGKHDWSEVVVHYL